MTPGLTARTFDSGFPLAHDSYHSISAASDNKIYYVLSSESLDTGAQLFAYDPQQDCIEKLGDLTQACGEAGLKAIPQGKSHVNFVESAGKLYFATHVGYYNLINGMEKLGTPPAGYLEYPGGNLLAFDMTTHQFQDLGVTLHCEGIITMNMDVQRRRMYGLTWPTGHFFRYDLTTQEWKDLGPVAQQGENGEGGEYQTICRSLGLDPRDESVYFTNSLGDIRRYRFDTDHYGVHGNSGYLFRFDPRAARLDVLDRLTSLPSQWSGMFDQFSYGYLGFALGPDGDTLHYLTGGPIYLNERRVEGKESTAKGESKGQENLHLITYKISQAHQDHGPIFFENGERPAYVNSIAIGKDGTVYALTRVGARTDLMAIASPVEARP